MRHNRIYLNHVADSLALGSAGLFDCNVEHRRASGGGSGIADGCDARRHLRLAVKRITSQARGQEKIDVTNQSLLFSSSMPLECESRL